ncbi:SdpI family protein [Heyndrickxia sporothermodurans]|uniref:SdpI family protein n=1 Tax=Heyndrickxia sporothermodurans TaxID=46224 RepID=UPI0035E37356
MKKNIFVVTNILLCIIIGFIFITKLPQQLGIHWSSSDSPDVYVNKFVGIFIFPIAILLTWIIHSVIFKKMIKTQLNNLILNILTGTYTVIHLFLLMENLDVLNIKVELSGVLIGIIIIIIGNLMQKAKMNPLYGVRTTWSMKNEEEWRLSNRFGAKVLVAYGFAVILVAILLPKYFFPIIMSLLLIVLIVVVYASYYFYKKSLKINN